MTPSGRRASLFVTTAMAFGLIGCSTTSLPEEGAAYVPTVVEEQPVHDRSEFARSIGESLAADGVDVVARAVGEPTADDPAPALVLLAFTGLPDDVSATEEALSEAMGVGGGDPSEVEIEGTTVLRRTIDQGGRTIGLARARPRAEVLLVGLAFDGEPGTAGDGVGEMLRQASSPGT